MDDSAIALILSIILSALFAQIGHNRKIGAGWGFFWCLILGPFIGLIIILCSKKKDVEFLDDK